MVDFSTVADVYADQWLGNKGFVEDRTMTPLNAFSKPQQHHDNIHTAKKDARWVRRQRQRMNFVAVCQCLFLPWILFCIVLGVTSFDIHYSKPWLCWLIVSIATIIVLWFGYFYVWATVNSKSREDEGAEPTWFVFLFITACLALACAVVLGNQIFANFTQRYYDYGNLNDYRYIDVQKMRGQQLMDGARLKFVEGTTLDLRKAIGFKNLHTYCVAPITFADPSGVKSELSSYDFWAVGLDCCSGDNTDYHCGDFDNPKARGGLRLLEDDDRSYYRLAVQQAEGMYHINADHPLFLYWTEDPVGEMNSWQQDAYKFFYLAMLVHFLWQLLCVVLAVVGFSKMGMY